MGRGGGEVACPTPQLPTTPPQKILHSPPKVLQKLLTKQINFHSYHRVLSVGCLKKYFHWRFRTEVLYCLIKRSVLFNPLCLLIPFSTELLSVFLCVCFCCCCVFCFSFETVHTVKEIRMRNAFTVYNVHSFRNLKIQSVSQL